MNNPGIGDVRKLLYRILFDGWRASTDEARFPVLFDNEPDRGANLDKGYVQIMVRHGGASQTTTGEPGSRTFERTGLLICNLWTPLNTNLEQTDEQAEELRTVVEGRTLNADELTVWTFACSVEEQGPVNGMYLTTVETPFQYEVLK